MGAGGGGLGGGGCTGGPGTCRGLFGRQASWNRYSGCTTCMKQLDDQLACLSWPIVPQRGLWPRPVQGPLVQAGVMAQEADCTTCKTLAGVLAGHVHAVLSSRSADGERQLASGIHQSNAGHACKPQGLAQFCPPCWQTHDKPQPWMMISSSIQACVAYDCRRRRQAGPYLDTSGLCQWRPKLERNTPQGG